MSYRRRHRRWLRRMALGLAFASVMLAGRASVAAATVDERAGDARQVQVIPYLSQGILTQADADVAAAAAQPQKPRLNPYLPLTMARDYSAWQQPRQTPYMSLQDDVYGDSRELPEPFVAGVTDFPRVQLDSNDAATRPEPTNDGNWRFEWSDALPLVVGLVVLALVFGLALGQLRRPRIAGL